MSESVWIYLSLDCDAAGAPQLIDDVTQWMLSTGVIVAADKPDDFSGDYVGGPAATTILPPDFRPSQFTKPGFYGCVKPSAEWECIDSGSNFEEPPCPRCYAPLAFDPDRILSWLDTRIEPAAECSYCGHRGLLGDWESTATPYCAYAHVTFRWWDSPLSDEFEQELLARLGSRARRVYRRW